MSGRKKSVISKASPHTIKKFELIEEYIKSWAQKLLLTESCNGLIFIDCMCNSGVYTDDAGQLVKGTAVRVSEALREASRTYTEKNIHIYLNDKDKARIISCSTIRMMRPSTGKHFCRFFKTGVKL